MGFFSGITSAVTNVVKKAVPAVTKAAETLTKVQIGQLQQGGALALQKAGIDPSMLQSLGLDKAFGNAGQALQEGYNAGYQEPAPAYTPISSQFSAPAKSTPSPSVPVRSSFDQIGLSTKEAMSNKTLLIGGGVGVAFLLMMIMMQQRSK